MKLYRWAGWMLGTAMALAAPVQAEDGGRIYGKVTTTRGDILEGFIRWDKNEGSWMDILNGSKEIPEVHRRKNEGRRQKRQTLRVLGVDLVEYTSDQDDPRMAESGIRFGHIRTLEVATGEKAWTLTLSWDWSSPSKERAPEQRSPSVAGARSICPAPMTWTATTRESLSP